jgi:two-component system phosphate regulon response regulator OmpR
MADPVHILLVDDDERILRLLSRYLQHEGYRVSCATCSRDMWHCYETESPELVLLDIVMPDMDGFTLARELRARSGIGIIMLTGKNDPIDTVIGLEIGADDYVTKPFDKRELLARIRSLMRRKMQGPARAVKDNAHTRSTTYLFDGWKMDLATFGLESPTGEEVRMTHHEFSLLRIFVQSKGNVLSRDQILQQLSGRDWMINDRSVDVLISKLRKKIEVDPDNPKLFRTMRNAGYQFTGKVSKI